MSTPLRLIATSSFGLESVVARELTLLGFTNLSAHNGYVEFDSDSAGLARANLWLRAADRVLLKVGQFHADTFDMLYEQTKALPWSDLLPEDANFPVDGRSVKSTLSSVPACQRIVKKAIVDSLQKRYPRETFAETGSRYSIEVSLQKDDALLTIDTSGAGLHKRGYRQLSAAAPIKETLAAALVLLSRWQSHRPFADPLCGSGTIAIEAGLIGCNMAPGLNRSFVSEDWDLIAQSDWDAERAAAREAIRKNNDMEIYAYDVDKEVLSLAGYHVRQAGLDGIVRIAQRDVGKFETASEYGCIVTNPPYGERMMEERETTDLYRKMGRAFNAFDTWSYFVITSHPNFERYFGKRADKKRKLYNGRIQANFYQYLGPLPPRKG